jgi:fused signal recognition particle receptor
VLVQAPSPVSPALPSPLDWALWQLALAGLLLLLAIAFLVVWTRRRGAKARRLEAKKPPAEALPVPPPKVELAPSEAELTRRREAEVAHAEVERLAKERREAAEAAQKTQAQDERARLEQEAKSLKALEEAKKREEYQALKAAEKEARDRKAREAEETARLLAEAEAASREQEAQRLREAEEEERRRVAAQAGQTLAQGLDRTRNQGFMAKLNGLFASPKQLDDSVLAELEEVLFTADIGVRTASTLVETARGSAKRHELTSAEGLKGLIRREVERIVTLPRPLALEGGGPPHVVMVVGVNGSGKTTTIGKLAAKAHGAGKKVLLAAGDTFRAAAADQLEVWAQRAGVPLVKGAEGADPGSVVFEAVKRARDEGFDLVLADTAGRLHTQAPLMEELKKVKRVLGKALEGAPHEVLLVLDATMGQNAIAQAKQFHEAVGVTQIALTKLDGTAKGGVVIGICDELKLPVVWAGVGEKVADLRPFEPREFVSALFD